MALSRRVIGAAAVVLGAGLVGGVLILGNSGDSGSNSRSPASPDASQAPPPGAEAPVVPADGDCRLKVDAVTIAHAPETVAGFAQAGIEVDGISPATRVADIEHSMRVVSSTQINCDAETGYIGLRGGIAWRVGEDVAMEMRRMRLDIGNKTMTVYPKSVGLDGIPVADFDTGVGTRVDDGDRVIFTVPLALRPEAAQLANDALRGVLAQSDTAAFGSATFTATKVQAQS